jgi:hypothetical protein
MTGVDYNNATNTRQPQAVVEKSQKQFSCQPFGLFSRAFLAALRVSHF